MKRTSPSIALQRILDALESELLDMPSGEIKAAAAETGMTREALLSDTGAALGIRSVRDYLQSDASREAEQADQRDDDELQSKPLEDARHQRAQ